MIALLVVAGLLVVAEAVAIVLLARSLGASRAEARELAARFVDADRESSVVTLAGSAVRALATTASRLRSGGVTGLLSGSLDELERWAREDRADIVRVASADGTVTVMFTDIENSTTLNDELGDTAWLKVLAAHDRVVRTSVEQWAGHVVKNQGDGFMIVFGEPDAALAAAADIQRRLASPTSRALRRVPLLVRIGVHVGRVVSRQGDFFGRTVAVAARVAALARGGQVLATDDVLSALRDDAPPTDDLGEQTLKGIADAVRVHAVEWAS